MHTDPTAVARTNHAIAHVARLKCQNDTSSTMSGIGLYTQNHQNTPSSWRESCLRRHAAVAPRRVPGAPRVRRCLVALWCQEICTITNIYRTILYHQSRIGSKHTPSVPERCPGARAAGRVTIPRSEVGGAGRPRCFRYAFSRPCPAPFIFSTSRDDCLSARRRGPGRCTPRGCAAGCKVGRTKTPR